MNVSMYEIAFLQIALNDIRETLERLQLLEETRFEAIVMMVEHQRTNVFTSAKQNKIKFRGTL